MAFYAGLYLLNLLKIFQMYNTTERNELNRRRSALVLAIGLHLGLAALIFLYTTDKPETGRPATQPVKMEKSGPAPQPKVVNLP